MKRKVFSKATRASPKTCALQHLTNLSLERTNKSSSASPSPFPPSSSSSEIQTEKTSDSNERKPSTRQKRALKEITNLPKKKRNQKSLNDNDDEITLAKTVVPFQERKESEDQSYQSSNIEMKRLVEQDPEIFEFQRTISNSLVHSIQQIYERDTEGSIITDVTVNVPNIQLARELFANVGNVKFSSQFLERRAISSSQEFMSWMKLATPNQSLMNKVQFEKADVIMSSTELTLRVWLTRKNQEKNSTGTPYPLRSKAH